MTIFKIPNQTANMIAAWTGALATLAFLIFRSGFWRDQLALPLALVMAILAASLIASIVRFKPSQITTLALSGFLGVTFTVFSCCLTHVFGR